MKLIPTILLGLGAVTAPLAGSQTTGGGDIGGTRLCTRCDTIAGFVVQGPVHTKVCITTLGGVEIDRDTLAYNAWTETHPAYEDCVFPAFSRTVDCEAGGGGAISIHRIDRTADCECDGTLIPGSGLCTGFWVVSISSTPSVVAGGIADRCIECMR